MLFFSGQEILNTGQNTALVKFQLGAGAILGRATDVVHVPKYSHGLAQSAVYVLLCNAIWCFDDIFPGL